MLTLDQLDPETQALCLGARTTVDPGAGVALRRLVAAGLDWNRLWQLGDRHDVLPLLATSLPAAAGDAVPADWRERATRRRHGTLRRNGRMAEVLDRVLDGFASAGVEAIPVKGLAVTELLYGSLGARGAADLDVLVRPADLAASRAALAALGFAQGAPSFATLTHEFHDPPFYLGDGLEQVCLELHRDLWADRFFRSDADGLWRRSVDGTFLGRTRRLLSLEDMLVHLAIHRTRSTLRLRWVCDVGELVRSHGARLDWDAVADRASRVGARTATWTVLSLAQRFLGAEPPAGVLDRFRVSRSKQELLERTCGARATLGAQRSTDDQSAHLTLRVLEQDGAGQIARALDSSLRRSARRVLHDRGVRRLGPRAA